MSRLKIYHDRFSFETEEDRANAYRALFSTPQGENVLMDIAFIGGFYDSKLSQSPNEALQNEGKRSMIAKIIQLASINKIEKVD